MGCVAPSIINTRGQLNYAPFPLMMGKMSTMRKIDRMVRELKQFTGYHIYAD